MGPYDGMQELQPHLRNLVCRSIWDNCNAMNSSTDFCFLSSIHRNSEANFIHQQTISLRAGCIQFEPSSGSFYFLPTFSPCFFLPPSTHLGQCTICNYTLQMQSQMLYVNRQSSFQNCPQNIFLPFRKCPSSCPPSFHIYRIRQSWLLIGTVESSHEHGACQPSNAWV